MAHEDYYDAFRHAGTLDKRGGALSLQISKLCARFRELVGSV